MARPMVQEGVTVSDRQRKNEAVDRVIADIRAELTLSGEDEAEIPGFNAVRLRALIRAILREAKR